MVSYRLMYPGCWLPLRSRLLIRRNNVITTHLLSIENPDWPKLHDIFKARDAKTWQSTIPVGFPVRVCALKLLFINNFHDVVARIKKQMHDSSKTCLEGLLTLLICVGKLHERFSASAVSPAQNRINRPTRHVLLHTSGSILSDAWTVILEWTNLRKLLVQSECCTVEVFFGMDT